MIHINRMQEKYTRIVYYGAIGSVLKKYIPYIRKKDCVLDADENKQNSSLFEIKIQGLNALSGFDADSTAIIILPLNYETEIYSAIRKNGFKGDVYSDDMVCLDANTEATDFDGNYTIEKHTQMLIALLKKYEVKDIIVSPGTCNVTFVYSIMNDPDFRVWSCIDERSAAYMACGISSTTGNPVVISCTGATASRNYMPALTEAFYSHLPIIAITSSRDSYMIGNGIEQMTDRLHLPTDIVNESVEIDEIHNMIEKRYCELKINRCLSMLKMHEGGPVHINLITHFSRDFSVRTLPMCKKIETICYGDELPSIYGRVGFYLRPHAKISEYTTGLMEKFCEKYNAVVLGDHLSNYKGKYFIQWGLLANESLKYSFDILIYSGTVNRTIDISNEQSWRVSTDGKIEDSFLNQKYMFDMTLDAFLESYNRKSSVSVSGDNLYALLINEQNRLYEKVTELPFSNMWIANKLSKEIPMDSIVYFGIFSSLRNWSYFEMDSSIECYSTVGGYGIDGTLSAMLGSSFVKSDRLHFCILGDLSMLYDLNSLGNRYIGNNVRIILINNNGGNSLMYKNCLPQDEQTGQLVAAKNHFHNEDRATNIFKAIVTDLGFVYLAAESKEQFNTYSQEIIGKSDRPVLLEIKVKEEDEFSAVEMIQSIR